MKQLDGDGLGPSNGARPATWCWKAIRKPARNTQKPNSTASTPETIRKALQANPFRAASMGPVSFDTGDATKPLRIAELRAEGLTDSEVAEAMGVSRRTVQRYLRLAD